MKMGFKTLATAISTLAIAVMISASWAVGSADAARLYVSPRYAAAAVYHPSAGLPWYAVRAYYFNGPWSGPYYSWAGWSDYAARNGIGCTPGTIVKGGDGIWYNCQ